LASSGILNVTNKLKARKNKRKAAFKLPFLQKKLYFGWTKMYKEKIIMG
jgi:hypothetical protein